MSKWTFSAAATKTATTTSSAFIFPNTSKNSQGLRVVRGVDSGRLWISFGTTSTISVSSATGMELIAGVVEEFMLSPGFDYYAIICDTGTVNVNIAVFQPQS